MSQARIADTRPKAVELKAGQTVYWCSCGRSKQQPFCDGSHQGTDFEPLAFTPDKDDRYFFCTCKRTQKPPFCDGSHKDITEADLDAQQGQKTVWYKVADPDALQDGEVRAVQAGEQALALTFYRGEYAALDNACPHQGGPLGEGSIECDDTGDCWLRCPWHGWDFHPTTGRSPGSHDDGVPLYPLEKRDDGIYVAVKERTAHTRTVADLVAETLSNWGVRQVFGMVGHSNLGLADAIRRQVEVGQMHYYGIRHEGAAAFAASAYAKLTGKPAACLSIAGPGATNLLTGLWDARVDRAPVLALTGQVNTQVLGPGAFQEIDLAAAFAPVASFSQTVLPGSHHVELANLACKHAIVERDVAHLIFPDEVQQQVVDDEVKPGSPEGRLGDPAIQPAAAALQAATKQLQQARRPVIVVGHGARQAMAAVLMLAEQLGAAVLTTFKAKGLLPDDHPLAAGVLGRSGTPVASWCMNEADLLLVLGASFSNHTGIAANKTIVQVDFDRMALGKFHPVTVPVWGEIGVTVQALCAALAAGGAWRDQRPDLAERHAIWRDEKALRRSRAGQGVNPATIFQALSEACPADAIMTVDVGNNAYAFGRYFEVKQQRVLMSGYLGSIGFALPAALGACAATEEAGEWQGRRVVSVSGDGGFGQYMAEFTTAVKYRLPLTHVLLNDNALAKISKEQRAEHFPVWETDLVNPGFAAYAELCGGLGIRVSEAAQLPAALAQALAHPGPSLVEIMTEAGAI